MPPRRPVLPRDPLLLRLLLKAIRPSTNQTNLYRWIGVLCVPVYGYVYFGRAFLTDWRVFTGGLLLLYLLSVACILPLNYLTEATFRRYPEPEQWLKRFAAHALVLGAATGPGTFLTMRAFDAVHLFGYRYQAREAGWIIGSVVVFNILIAALFEVTLALGQWQTNELATQQLEHQQLQGQLDQVKQQISPHFLFNSLNSLSVLIGEDARQAERFVDEMATVYRYLLQAHRPGQRPGQPSLTTLDAELRYIQSYAYLLRTRYGAGLELDIRPGDEAQRTGTLLPLTLQTLVDNAIRHNVVSAARPLHIAIDATAAGQVRVHNTRQKRTVRVASQQASLTTLQARYQQLGPAPALEIEASETHFIVAVQLLTS